MLLFLLLLSNLTSEKVVVFSSYNYIFWQFFFSEFMNRFCV